MNITSKSRYALKIMMDLALYQENLTHRVDIANRQGVPLDYMDQILLKLKERHLIDSTRGRKGGYRLSRKPEQISIFEILNAVEDGFVPVQCLEGVHTCQAEQFCQSKDAWSTISNAIRETLSGIMLSSVASLRPPALSDTLDHKSNLGQSSTHASTSLHHLNPPDARPHECRAPRRTSGSGNSPIREPKNS